MENEMQQPVSMAQKMEWLEAQAQATSDKKDLVPNKPNQML
jgi:hypothetical protein